MLLISKKFGIFKLNCYSKSVNMEFEERLYQHCINCVLIVLLIPIAYHIWPSSVFFKLITSTIFIPWSFIFHKSSFLIQYPFSCEYILEGIIQFQSLTFDSSYHVHIMLFFGQIIIVNWILDISLPSFIYHFVPLLCSSFVWC